MPSRIFRGALAAAVLTLLVVVPLASGSGQPKPGSLDPTFGKRGRVITGFGSDSARADALAIQPDGKIVVGGSVSDSAGRHVAFALVRYTHKGMLDATFGKAGRVEAPIGPLYDEISSIALQRDGKIVAAGVDQRASGEVRLLLAHYMPSGTLDASFGRGGTVVQQIDTAAFGHSVAVLHDGRILVAGAFSPDGSTWNAFVERFTPNGSIDPAFGTDGMVRVASIGAYYAVPLVVQRDGKILIGGSDDTETGFALARFNSDGSIDQSFGFTYGHIDTSFGSETKLTRLAVQRSGKIVAAGFVESPVDGSFDFAVARYHSDGVLDRRFGGFGAEGRVLFSIAPNRPTDEMTTGLAIQRDGKIIISGTLNGDTIRGALVRLTRAGLLDHTFGRRGVVAIKIGKWWNAADALARQRDGRIVVAGTSALTPPYTVSKTAFAVTRYRAIVSKRPR